MVDKTDWIKQRDAFKKRLEENQTQDDSAIKTPVIVRKKLSIPSIFSSPKASVTEDNMKKNRMSSYEPYSNTKSVMVDSMSKSVDCLNSISERKHSAVQLPEKTKVLVLEDMTSDLNIPIDRKVVENKSCIGTKLVSEEKLSDLRDNLTNIDDETNITRKSSTATLVPRVTTSRKSSDILVLEIKPYQTRNPTASLLTPSPTSPLKKYFEGMSSPVVKSSQIGFKTQDAAASLDISKTSIENNNAGIPRTSNVLRKVSSTEMDMLSSEIKRLQIGIKVQNAAGSPDISKALIENNNAGHPKKTSNILTKTSSTENDILSSELKSLQIGNKAQHAADCPDIVKTEIMLNELPKEHIPNGSLCENKKIIKPPRKMLKNLSINSVDEERKLPNNNVTINKDENIDEVVLRKNIVTPNSATICFNFTNNNPIEFSIPLLQSNNSNSRSTVPEEQSDIIHREERDFGNKTSIMDEEIVSKVEENDCKLSDEFNNDMNHLYHEPLYENIEMIRKHASRILIPIPAIRKCPIPQIRINYLNSKSFPQLTQEESC